MNTVCEVCGNDLELGTIICPYCGNKNEQVEPRGFTQKTVNLEAGRPVLEQALSRMTASIVDAKRNNVQVLTFIHGYGSTGKGGVIRVECRKSLDYMKTKGEISDYITGEDFNKRSGRVGQLLRRFPELTTHQYLNRGNKGITLVILK